MTLVVSSWSGAGRRLYGNRFLRQQVPFWSPDTEFLIYEDTPLERELPDNVSIKPMDSVGEFREFRRLYQGDHAVRGTIPNAAWKNKELDTGYSYRFDAWKFCRKVFAMADAAASAKRPHDLLVWLDGDVVPLAHTLPPHFMDKMLGPDYSFGYLGRTGRHSETGFLVFRLPQADEIFRQMVQTFLSGEFKNLEGWTDSHVFDDAIQQHSYIRGKSLTKHPEVSEAFAYSPLAQYFRHLKGNLKNVHASD